MRIAITGGTGFVGRNAAKAFIADGHEAILIARGMDTPGREVRKMNNARLFHCGVDDLRELERAFEGCKAVVHCAGINRELGEQTYQHVHVEGTANVVKAARQAGVEKVVLISFLRARPNCGSPYHESKFAAEEIVRGSGLDYTILRCGVIYGRGDHMLDHLSHAFHTFPVFAFVGVHDKPIRPNAVADVARIIKAAATTKELSCKTIAVIGPEQLTLREAVRRVARNVGRRPVMFPLPVWFHYLLGYFVEKLMTVPLVSTAQVRMLAEGLAQPALPCDPMPIELAPCIRFTDEEIQKGLPKPGPFTTRDIRCCRNPGSPDDRAPHQAKHRHTCTFFEMP